LVKRSGRRPGNQDTKASILEAARRNFAEKGFDQASIRAIAGDAGVDPALVHHYFGTKEKLFLAVMNAPINPGELIPQALSGPREQAGERLVRMALTVWDSPAGSAAVAMFRSAMSNEWTARLLREFVITQILRRAVASLVLDPEEAPMRTSLVATQIAGVMIGRYVLRIEPMASADREVLVAAIAPNVQRFLDDPMPEVFSSHNGDRAPGAAGAPDPAGR
jgi:AcrR family transcriptional regulator